MEVYTFQSAFRSGCRIPWFHDDVLSFCQFIAKTPIQKNGFVFMTMALA